MSGPTAGESQPNVVLLTSHDLGQHLGCYGVETVETPHLDGLAADGVRFENAFGTTPKCSPSRGSMLTGRYPQSNGLMGLVHSPWNWRLNEGEATIPELLGAAGYETHLVGSQHVAPDDDRLGFDHSHGDSWHDTDGMTEGVEEIFSGDRDAPIYAQVGFWEVHRPFERAPYDEDGVYVPDYLEGTEAQRTDLAKFQADINFLDELVGDILGTLERTGVRDDTVIVFASEHGIPYPGAKGTLRSAGVEISCLLDGPDTAFDQDGPIEDVFSNVDILPTVFDVLDLEIPRSVQGRSWLDYLRGTEPAPPRDAAFTQQIAPTRGIITDEYNLLRNFSSGRTPQFPTDASPRGSANTSQEDLPRAQLYDRQADPFELDDVAAAKEEVVTDLSARVRTWMADIDDPLLEGPIRKPYYRRAMHDLLTVDRDQHETDRFFEG